jgi:hypothetical protein
MVYDSFMQYNLNTLGALQMKVIDIVDGKEVLIPADLTKEQIFELLEHNSILVRFVSDSEILVSQGFKVID